MLKIKGEIVDQIIVEDKYSVYDSLIAI